VGALSNTKVDNKCSTITHRHNPSFWIVSEPSLCSSFRIYI